MEHPGRGETWDPLGCAPQGFRTIQSSFLALTLYSGNSLLLPLGLRGLIQDIARPTETVN